MSYYNIPYNLIFTFVQLPILLLPIPTGMTLKTCSVRRLAQRHRHDKNSVPDAAFPKFKLSPSSKVPLLTLSREKQGGITSYRTLSWWRFNCEDVSESKGMLTFFVGYWFDMVFLCKPAGNFFRDSLFRLNLWLLFCTFHIYLPPRSRP